MWKRGSGICRSWPPLDNVKRSPQKGIGVATKSFLDNSVPGVSFYDEWFRGITHIFSWVWILVAWFAIDSINTLQNLHSNLYFQICKGFFFFNQKWMLNYTKYLPSWNSIPVVIMTLLSPFSYLFLNPFFLTIFCLLFILQFPFCDQCCQRVYPWFAFQVFAHRYYSFVSLAQIYWIINIFLY